MKKVAWNNKKNFTNKGYRRKLALIACAYKPG